MMRAVRAPHGARVVDSLPFSESGTAADARALRADGVDGVALYLGVALRALVDACADAGLGVFGVTLGDHFDGAQAVAALRAWGMPAGTTHFLDVEGESVFSAPIERTIASVVGWAKPVFGAGYIPGLYLGEPQPLTSDEAYHLPVFRYWKGAGSARDRFGRLVEPACGWSLVQAWPSHPRAGVMVDDDMGEDDFRGRSVIWAVADAAA